MVIGKFKDNVSKLILIATIVIEIDLIIDLISP